MFWRYRWTKDVVNSKRIVIEQLIDLNQSFSQMGDTNLNQI